MNVNEPIAQWESVGGAHWAELWRNKLGYYYRGLNCGGTLRPCDSDESAIVALQTKVNTGYFQNDNSKHVIKRVA